MDNLRSAQKRIPKACTRCRQKKAKCNGLTPCLRCREDSAVCAYDYEPKRPSSKKFTSEYTRSLERQCSLLINGLQELYLLIEKGHGWPGPPLQKLHGRPLPNDILGRLGINWGENGGSFITESSEEVRPQLHPHEPTTTSGSNSRLSSPEELVRAMEPTIVAPEINSNLSFQTNALQHPALQHPALQHPALAGPRRRLVGQEHVDQSPNYTVILEDAFHMPYQASNFPRDTVFPISNDLTIPEETNHSFDPHLREDFSQTGSIPSLKPNTSLLHDPPTRPINSNASEYLIGLDGSENPHWTHSSVVENTGIPGSVSDLVWTDKDDMHGFSASM